MKKNGISKEQLAVDLCIDNKKMTTLLQGKCNIETYSAISILHKEQKNIER